MAAPSFQVRPQTQGPSDQWAQAEQFPQMGGKRQLIPISESVSDPEDLVPPPEVDAQFDVVELDRNQRYHDGSHPTAETVVNQKVVRRYRRVDLVVEPAHLIPAMDQRLQNAGPTVVTKTRGGTEPGSCEGLDGSWSNGNDRAWKGQTFDSPRDEGTPSSRSFQSSTPPCHPPRGQPGDSLAPRAPGRSALPRRETESSQRDVTSERGRDYSETEISGDSSKNLEGRRRSVGSFDQCGLLHHNPSPEFTPTVALARAGSLAESEEFPGGEEDASEKPLDGNKSGEAAARSKTPYCEIHRCPMDCRGCITECRCCPTEIHHYIHLHHHCDTGSKLEMGNSWIKSGATPASLGEHDGAGLESRTRAAHRVPPDGDKQSSFNNGTSKLVLLQPAPGSNPPLSSGPVYVTMESNVETENHFPVRRALPAHMISVADLSRPKGASNEGGSRIFQINPQSGNEGTAVKYTPTASKGKASRRASSQAAKAEASPMVVAPRGGETLEIDSVTGGDNFPIRSSPSCTDEDEMPYRVERNEPIGLRPVRSPEYVPSPSRETVSDESMSPVEHSPACTGGQWTQKERDIRTNSSGSWQWSCNSDDVSLNAEHQPSGHFPNKKSIAGSRRKLQSSANKPPSGGLLSKEREQSEASQQHTPTQASSTNDFRHAGGSRNEPDEVDDKDFSANEIPNDGSRLDKRRLPSRNATGATDDGAGAMSHACGVRIKSSPVIINARACSPNEIPNAGKKVSNRRPPSKGMSEVTDDVAGASTDCKDDWCHSGRIRNKPSPIQTNAKDFSPNDIHNAGKKVSNRRPPSKGMSEVTDDVASASTDCKDDWGHTGGIRNKPSPIQTNAKDFSSNEIPNAGKKVSNRRPPSKGMSEVADDVASASTDCKDDWGHTGGGIRNKASPIQTNAQDFSPNEVPNAGKKVSTRPSPSTVIQKPTRSFLAEVTEDAASVSSTVFRSGCRHAGGSRNKLNPATVNSKHFATDEIPSTLFAAGNVSGQPGVLDLFIRRPTLADNIQKQLRALPGPPMLLIVLNDRKVRCSAEPDFYNTPQGRDFVTRASFPFTPASPLGSRIQTSQLSREIRFYLGNPTVAYGTLALDEPLVQGLLENSFSATDTSVPLYAQNSKVGSLSMSLSFLPGVHHGHSNAASMADSRTISDAPLSPVSLNVPKWTAVVGTRGGGSDDDHPHVDPNEPSLRHPHSRSSTSAINIVGLGIEAGRKESDVARLPTSFSPRCRPYETCGSTCLCACGGCGHGINEKYHRSHLREQLPYQARRGCPSRQPSAGECKMHGSSTCPCCPRCQTASPKSREGQKDGGNSSPLRGTKECGTQASWAVESAAASTAAQPPRRTPPPCDAEVSLHSGLSLSTATWSIPQSRPATSGPVPSQGSKPAAHRSRRNAVYDGDRPAKMSNSESRKSHPSKLVRIRFHVKGK